MRSFFRSKFFSALIRLIGVGVIGYAAFPLPTERYAWVVIGIMLINYCESNREVNDT